MTTKKTKSAATPSLPKRVKSGYARAVLPEAVEQFEREGFSVPIAQKNGVQEGVIPPAQRQYKQGIYKQVSADQAWKNAIARQEGTMEPIAGGLDDQGMTLDVQSDNPKRVAKRAIRDFDPMVGGEPIQDEELEPGSCTLEAEERSMQRSSPRPAVGRPTTKSADTAIQATAAEQWMQGRTKIQLELQDGFMQLNCIDVVESPYSVTIMLPRNHDGANFIPKPGTDLNIMMVNGEKQWKCYFPGTYFEIEPLNIMGLVFVKGE